MEKNMAEVIKVIKAHKIFLISTHINPDPDALTSELALALVLESLGKKVHIVNDADVPERFRFLPGTQRVKGFHPEMKIRYDVAILLDCGDFGRIGPVYRLFKENKPLVNIDHHVTNNLFGDFNLVKPDASSTAEVLFGLFKKMKRPLTKDLAVLLYVGIMTDTGSFRYDNTSHYTHTSVGELMRFDIEVGELYRKLYEAIPLNDLMYFSKVVNGFEPLFKGFVVYLELKKNVIRKFSESFDLRDKIFRYLRAINGVEVIVILTEISKSKTRVNFRSQGKVDVAQLAFKFDGGGHSRASGCVLFHGLKETRQKVLWQIKKEVKKLKASK